MSTDPLAPKYLDSAAFRALKAEMNTEILPVVCGRTATAEQREAAVTRGREITAEWRANGLKTHHPQIDGDREAPARRTRR